MGERCFRLIEHASSGSMTSDSPFVISAIVADALGVWDESIEQIANYISKIISFVGHMIVDHPNEFITACATFIIAWFTVILTRSTIRLWRTIKDAAERQAVEMERSVALARDSVAVAKKAAEAAEKNADAAIGVQLPRLTLTQLELFEPGPPYGPEADSFRNQVQGGIPPEHFQVAVTFYNFGETTALVTGFCIEHIVGESLPPVPRYETVVPMSAATIIKAGGTYGLKLRNFFIMLTPSEIDGIQNRSEHLWVYGYISFLDFLNLRHEHRFCQRWEARSILGGHTGFVFESDAPPDYTRSQ
jgi:hypothetical protein